LIPQDHDAKVNGIKQPRFKNGQFVKRIKQDDIVQICGEPLLSEK
jgi:hypothetical protein